MKEIVDTGVNRRAGPGLHPQRWWSKECTINKRKMVLEEIHHRKEVRRIATAVGQRKQGVWTKWETAKDRVVTWDGLKHMEPPKIEFPYKGSL